MTHHMVLQALFEFISDNLSVSLPIFLRRTVEFEKCFLWLFIMSLNLFYALSLSDDHKI